MMFSVIIPVRSVTDYLQESIAQLKLLDFTDFEVIIILDKYEPLNFNNDTRFRIMASGQVGPGKKRNLGAANAQGGILAFLDDDAYPAKTWLSEAARIFSDSSVYALGSPAITPENASLLEKTGGKVLESWLVSGITTYRHLPKHERLIDDYPTVNLFVRKDAFWAVGGFSDAFWPGEDTKLCLDLVEKYGRKFNYSPRPIVYHHRRKLLLPHLKQVSRYGLHRGRFAKIFPATSRLPMYFVPSMFVVGLFFGPVFAAFSSGLSILYFSVIVLYLTLLMSEAIKLLFREKNLIMMIYFIVGVFYTHIIYGLNFILGFIRVPRLKLKSVDPKSGNYLEG